MKIRTSYFYQIRNFQPWMIPVSTALSDPAWYRPPAGQEYYIDKRGIINGLRYEPLIVQRNATWFCPCDNPEKIGKCMPMTEYYQMLNALDFQKIMRAFEFCANKFHRPFDDHEPIIVLMVYEAPSNPCSERLYLQNYFTNHGVWCKELEYPIRES